MKEQSTTGVTSLFFLSFLLKNGYYAELRDRPFGYLGGGGGAGGSWFLSKKIFWFLICKKKIKWLKRGTKIIWPQR